MSDGALIVIAAVVSLAAFVLAALAFRRELRIYRRATGRHRI